MMSEIISGHWHQLWHLYENEGVKGVTYRIITPSNWILTHSWSSDVLTYQMYLFCLSLQNYWFKSYRLLNASTCLTVLELQKPGKQGLANVYRSIHHWLPDSGKVASDSALWSSIKGHQRGSSIIGQTKLPINGVRTKTSLRFAEYSQTPRLRPPLLQLSLSNMSSLRTSGFNRFLCTRRSNFKLHSLSRV